MKKTLLAGFIATLSLAGSVSVARPPTNFSNLVGVWNNANPSTGGIVQVVVRSSSSGLTIQAFGACSPTPCNHGIVRARAFSPAVGTSAASGFSAARNFGFKSTSYNAILQGSSMTLLTQDTFAGADTRFNYPSMERFVRATPAQPAVDLQSVSELTHATTATDIQ